MKRKAKKSPSELTHQQRHQLRDLIVAASQTLHALPAPVRAKRLENMALLLTMLGEDASARFVAQTASIIHESERAQQQLTQHFNGVHA